MAKDPEEQESRGFKVQDRRRFVDAETRGEESRTEETRDAVPPPGAAAPPGTASFGAADPAAARKSGATLAATSGDAADADFAHATGDESAFAELSFSTFIMGLTTQALMHLGEIPDPVHQHVAHDLPAAKQMIDLLGILRDKTKGNLDAAEEQLLGEVLYDLRMRYVEMARVR